MQRKIDLGLAWCGPAFVVVFLIGFIPVAGFIPHLTQPNRRFRSSTSTRVT